jgi:CRP/FNR family transcriptional regulator
MTTESVASLVASGFDNGLAELLVHHSRIIGLSKGEVLFREGDACESFVVVISGCLNVQKVTPDGHEMVLYRVEAGQECNLATTCLLGGDYYPAESVAEVESEVLLLPRSAFFQLLERQSQFRSLVFKNIEHGMIDLLDLVQTVAFDQMDHRLAALLVKRSHDGAVVETTHKELAAELGTAREVVSRLLKEFEHHGWVKLHRGLIEVVDKGALAKL